MKRTEKPYRPPMKLTCPFKRWRVVLHAFYIHPRYGGSHPALKRAPRALKRVFSVSAPIDQKRKKAPTTESDECP